MFHVKHSAEKPLFPEAMTTGRSEMSDLFFVIHRLLAWPLRT